MHFIYQYKQVEKTQWRDTALDLDKQHDKHYLVKKWQNPFA